MGQIKFQAEALVSEAINEFEIYILNNILRWKTAYATPYDFIQIIMQRATSSIQLDPNTEAMILTKATQISELLLLCKEISYNL